jgi:glycosyltransferase involved in cell wall biosynthesis
VSEHILTLARALRQFPVEPVLAVLKNGAVAEKAGEIELPLFRVQRKFRGDVSAVVRLAGLIRRESIDLVHTHTINSNFYGRCAALLAGVPAVTTVHTDLQAVIRDDYPLRITRAIVLDVNAFMNRYASRLITVSETMRQTMLTWGIDPKEISVVYHGLDTNAVRAENFPVDEAKEQFGFSGQELIVGAAGRLVPVKNFEMFLQAARLLVDRKAQLRFLLIGDGPSRRLLERLAADLGVREKIVFSGYRKDFIQALSSLDICVITSRTESTSLVALQAMALKKPVIATRVASLPEIILDNQTGILVPLDDPVKLAESIERLAADAGLRETFGKAGRKWVEEKFDARRMAEQTWRIYEEVLLKS